MREFEYAYRTVRSIARRISPERLDNGLLHIGLVTDVVAEGTQNYLVVHNIGAGARLEDVLMTWKIIGHYRMWKAR